MSDEPQKVIMSIDFGTYGFFAACAKSSDMVTAQPIKEWHRSGGLAYEKILNAILLRKSDPDEVLAYGFAAVEMYMEAKEEGDHEDMALFENFKLQLLQNGDVNFDANKPIKAVDGVTTRGLCPLVAQCLGQIKHHCVEYYQNRIDPDVGEHEILWVVSVPAKWSLMSREAMKQCCYHPLVGIREENLMIVSEPEAAGAYLMYETDPGKELRVGDRFAVLDCGSGTFDTVAYELMAGKKVKEIHCPDGGLSGALDVDEAFEKLLKDLFTEELITQFQEESPVDWVQQMKNFQTSREQAKRTEPSRKVLIVDMLCETAEEEGVDFRANISNFHVDRPGAEAPLEFNTRLARHQLKIPNWLWRQLFSKAVDSIRGHTVEMLRSRECLGVQKLFLVGGFSQSDFIGTNIQDLLDDEFDEKVELVVPLRPEVAVTMGCLWAAHKKVTDKTVPFSYGYSFDRPCRRNDPQDRRRVDPNFPSGYKTVKCFGTLWEKGEEYVVGAIEKRQFPLSPGQQLVQINVHRSIENPAPWFIPMEEDPVISWTYPVPPQNVSARQQTLNVAFELADGDCLKCGIFVENDTGGCGTLHRFATDFPAIEA